MDGMPPSTHIPLIFSIVVPTYQRATKLESCLESLARTPYPQDQFEVIVVNDGGDTLRMPRFERFQTRLNLTLVDQKNAGPASARNTGAGKARGQILVFTDDDCKLAEDYLGELAQRVALTPDAMIGGRIVNGLKNNMCAAASQMLVDFLYKYFNDSEHPVTFFTSNNLALPAEHFDAVGGFDTTFLTAAGEDREFCDRWVHSGRTTVYAPELIVHHFHKMSFFDYWRQHFKYGRAAYHFHRVRSRQGRKSMTPEPLEFYLALLRYPLVHRRGPQAWLLAFLMFVSQVANALGYFWEAAARMLSRPTASGSAHYPNEPTATTNRESGRSDR